MGYREQQYQNEESVGWLILMIPAALGLCWIGEEFFHISHLFN